MKKLFVVVATVLALQAMPSHQASAHGSFGVSFSVFYDGLSPHGDWISVGSGVYGWRPVGVAAGWRPYTVGRWCWTDDGWYWMSDEPWGWASYHYGRWTYDDYYGWIWIPGYDWAPAWVEWRYGSDYVGWAPLGPYAIFHASWGIHYRTRWNTPHTWWNFVGCGYVASHNVHRYVYRNEHNTRYIGVTRSGGSVRNAGGRIVTRGPEREYIEQRGNVRIEPVRIREVDERATERVRNENGREQIEVYRPRITERSGADDDLGRPSRLRESNGRQIDLDTRKIDVRSREVEREEGRDVKRAEEFRQRDQVGRSEERRDDSRNNDQFQRDGGPRREDVGRGRENEDRSRERGVEQPQPPVRREDDARATERERSRGNEGRSREPQSREPQVRPDGRPERQPQVEPRERRREESSYERPQHEEFRSPNPERTVRRPEYTAPAPERRAEPQAPRREAPRDNGGGRSDGGRSRSR